MVSKTSFPAELMEEVRGDRRDDWKGPCLECSTCGCHPQHHKWSPMPPPGILSVHREPVSPEHFWVWAQNLKYKGGESSSKAHTPLTLLSLLPLRPFLVIQLSPSGGESKSTLIQLLLSPTLGPLGLRVPKLGQPRTLHCIEMAVPKAATETFMNNFSVYLSVRLSLTYTQCESQGAAHTAAGFWGVSSLQL